MIDRNSWSFGLSLFLTFSLFIVTLHFKAIIGFYIQ